MRVTALFTLPVPCCLTSMRWTLIPLKAAIKINSSFHRLSLVVVLYRGHRKVTHTALSQSLHVCSPFNLLKVAFASQVWEPGCTKATANGFFNHCVLPVHWTEHFLPHSYVVSTVTEATISPLSKLMAQGSVLSITSIHLSVSSLPHRLSLSRRVGHFGEILCPSSLFIL